MDQNRIKAQEKMKYFIPLILLYSISIDSKNYSDFPIVDDGAQKFTSTLFEKPQWNSDVRDYCFLRKELSYILQYEFTPIPIPAFKIKNDLSNIYITVDLDHAHHLQFQKLREAWEKFSLLNENNKICFSGVYLPASSPNGSVFIMVEEISGGSIRLALKDYWLNLE